MRHKNMKVFLIPITSNENSSIGGGSSIEVASSSKVHLEEVFRCFSPQKLLLRRSSHVSVMKNTSSSWLKINWVKSILVLVLLAILTSETWFHQIFMTKTLYLLEYQVFLKTDSPRSFSHSKPRITKTKTCFHVYVSIYVCLRQSKITTRTCIHVHVRLWVSL